MHPIRFVLLGGFLGSGKTTTLLRVARHYAAAGRRVGIIANDQAENLVDTETFRATGFVTEEVSGGCFCCRFDELIAAAGRLADGGLPDVLLAEPVGSCTDLVTTVLRPLKELYAERFSVAPYVTLLDPERAWQALAGSGPAAFSAKVTYLFKMQQHEADVVAVNKIDLLTPDRREALLPLVQRNFPKARVIALSARTGEGFDRLLEVLECNPPARDNATDVDYDLYTEGEAALGWLNAQWHLKADEPFEADTLLVDLLQAIRGAFARTGGEPAHVKVTLQADDALVVANLVDRGRDPELSRGSNRTFREGRLLINARAEFQPGRLQDIVKTAVSQLAVRNGIETRNVQLASFAPSRPQPTHRIVSPGMENIDE